MTLAITIALAVQERAAAVLGAPLLRGGFCLFPLTRIDTHTRQRYELVQLGKHAYLRREKHHRLPGWWFDVLVILALLISAVGYLTS